MVGNSVLPASLLALGLTMFDLLAHSVVRSSLFEARVMLADRGGEREIERDRKKQENRETERERQYEK